MAQLQAIDNENEEKHIDDNDIDEMFKKYSERVEEFEKNICSFPLSSNSIIKQSDNYLVKDEVYQHMKECYPLVHGSVLILVYHFLNIKKLYGTNIEKEFYKNMDIIEFFDRLSLKRSVAFYQPNDRYLLRNGHKHSGKWNLIGTDRESEVTDLDQINNITKDDKPTLNEYLSYDELIISALCGISSPTHFINNGWRRNCGEFDKNDNNKNKYPFQAIYIGLIGARFEKLNVMENLLMVITENQNTINNGFGYDENKNDKNDDEDIINLLDEELFLNKIAKSKKQKYILNLFKLFYGEKYLPIYDEIKIKYNNNDKYILNRYYKKTGYGNKPFLDKKLFKIRIQISFELFLFDADNRAKQRNVDNKLQGAYCYIVGLGTGVWSINKAEQDKIIVFVIKNIVKKSCLSNINVLYFGWMHQECMYKSNKNEECIFNINDKNKNEYYVKDKNGHKIFVYFGKNNPGDILSEKYKKCLKISMYAWDSNAFPGNEYYFGMLSSSGDPAAASCSTISYIQNSMINKEYINGKNTMLYFFDNNLGKYEFYKLKDIDFKNEKNKWLKKSYLSSPLQRQ